MGFVFSHLCLCIIIFYCFVHSESIPISNILARRKPILNYLVRYKIGQIRSGLHSGLHGFKHGVQPLGTSIYPTPYGEEHYHHFYLEPVPVSAPIPIPIHQIKSIPNFHGHDPHLALPISVPVLGGGPIQADIVHGKLAHSHFSLDAPFVHQKVNFNNFNNFHNFPPPHLHLTRPY